MFSKAWKLGDHITLDTMALCWPGLKIVVAGPGTDYGPRQTLTQAQGHGTLEGVF